MHEAPSGRHWIVEFYGAAGLADARLLRAALRRAVESAGATLIGLKFHRFGRSGGITGVALLAESHISIHSWPEFDYAALDIFMCGHRSRPEKALAALRESLKPRKVRIRRLCRGLAATSAGIQIRAPLLETPGSPHRGRSRQSSARTRR
ncbi:MAG TPA: adenosylmethionine decarboxylase [Steroidobacteraceae bacterium]|nr:adenosylmethionine decarboxylase [Steroidobacteraceae bacterium]